MRGRHTATSSSRAESSHRREAVARRDTRSQSSHRSCTVVRPTVALRDSRASSHVSGSNAMKPSTRVQSPVRRRRAAISSDIDALSSRVQSPDTGPQPSRGDTVEHRPVNDPVPSRGDTVPLEQSPLIGEELSRCTTVEQREVACPGCRPTVQSQVPGHQRSAAQSPEVLTTKHESNHQQ